MNHTPGPWYVLEVMDRKFVAAAPTEDHPYFRRTRHMDVCGEEDYPRKDADLKLAAAAPEMAKVLTLADELLATLNDVYVTALRLLIDQTLKAGGVR